MIQGNIPRIISVSALVTRTCTMIQTSLSLSMVSSIVLKSYFARLRHVPSFLTQRSVPASQLEFLILLLRQCLGDKFCLLISSSMLCLGAVSAGIQFSSTILLSDTAMRDVRSFDSITQVPVGYTNFRSREKEQVSGQGYLSDFKYAVSMPSTFAIFADLMKSSMTPQRQVGVDLTYRTRRAILPLGATSDRESLRSYAGYATMINSMTACLPPTFTDLLINASSEGVMLAGRVDGEPITKLLASINLTIPGIVNSSFHWAKGEFDDFHCDLSSKFFLTSRPGFEWTMFMYPLGDNSLFLLNFTAANASYLAGLTGPDTLFFGAVGSGNGSRNSTQLSLQTDGYWTRMRTPGASID